MPIVAADLEYYKSAASNSTGGAITATVWTDATLNNLFDDVTADESEVGASEYRKVFVKNNHGSLTWQSVVFWRSANTTSAEDEVSLGIGTSADDDGSSELSALTANAVIAVISDGADTRQVTLVGEDTSGVRATETLTLNGAVEVVGVQTFSKLYLAYVTSSNASRTITVKQGSGGTSRGTIATNKYSAILYLNPTSKSDGFELGNIAAGAAQALWLKRVVAAAADAETNNQGTVKCEGSTS